MGLAIQAFDPEKRTFTDGSGKCADNDYAIDTNLFIAFWDEDPALSEAAQTALDGSLVVAAPVFAELIAAPGRTEAFVSSFLEKTGVAIDWDLGEPVWRSAGRAFQSYARRKQRDSGARRILADFLIGADAQTRGYRLLTLDERLYKAAFPTLRLETVCPGPRR